jgi:tetratricopeptide (TPR) repeat protein
MTEARPPKFFIYACLLLALGTAALYEPATSFPFINFDDGDYIYENPVTQAGLTAHGFLWAFNGIHVGNWHPLTWLSHMLDCQLFGLNAGGHHLVNILFHIANTLLVFLFLRSTTGAQWRSAIVAALFAWHPLHVESVAWVAERKDVLSTFFWLLTLLAYVRYAESVTREEWRAASNASPGSEPKNRSTKLYYTLALLGCALALLSKPMAVTLPFTLLLVDVWPLNRIRNPELRIRNIQWLVVEKIPFFFLSFALCAVTFLVQRTAGAVSPVEWSSRLGNVPVAYARYLSKTFWPSDLAIVYPYIYQWPILAIIGSVVMLVLISALSLIVFRKHAWLASGWFWFLGTLVPVIGFVQVGAQSMADRYSYIPSIGLFVVVVWAVSEYCLSRSNGKSILAILGLSSLAGCVLATSAQLNYWQSTASLFFHAFEVTQNNYVAENVLGKTFENQGDLAHATAYYQDAVRIEPRYAVSQYNYGLALIAIGHKDEAFAHLTAAAKLDPRNADAQFNLGVFFFQNQRWTDAAHCFEATLQLRPRFAPAHLRLGETLVELKRHSEAAAQFREALRLQPDLANAREKLDQLLESHPELKTATR